MPSSSSAQPATPLQEGATTPDISTVDLDWSLEDISEAESTETFIANTCGCKMGPKNSPCSKLLTTNTIVKFRNESRELPKHELDLVILAQIRACRTTDTQPNSCETHHEKISDKSTTKYFVHGVRVCRTTFMFLHCVGHKRFEHLHKHFVEVGLTTRTHGNQKRLPKNAFGMEETSRLVTFVKNYARAHAMPMPGRMPNHRDKVMVLPSDVSKNFVYKKYCETNLLSVEACSMRSGNSFYHLSQ